MVEHLIYSNPKKQWSRLTLAVVAGTLESLSEAMPQRMGHTHLWDLHKLIHPGDLGTGLEPYLTFTTLSESSRMGLKWWSQFIISSEGCYARPTRAATLVPTFGDRSSTGTGGTFCLPGQVSLQMWKGKWKPNVIHFTSNWKELRTLLETLQQISSQKKKRRFEEQLSSILQIIQARTGFQQKGRHSIPINTRSL
mmetsp:Transcript_4992/g.7655  ORF Transcript_4992/g.7655 Transcript_4992/m.7655 type:complete len:195 (-) Transcript_4992:1000-1584(-)